MPERVRIGALADFHCAKTSKGALRPLFEQAVALCDILLLCGDLTDHGQPEEAEVLAGELAGLKVPLVGVLGNHDHHGDAVSDLVRILEPTGLRLLDGDDCEVLGVGLAGAKGFAGGFGRHTLEGWGEPAIKRFVYEAVEEALKLEKALARLSAPTRIAVLHYAPVQATVEGEPPAIFPFLGSSRLEEPINRYGVAAVFHGHAHHGAAEGRTSAGIPVYNVAMPVLRRHCGDGPPVRVIEVETRPG